MTRRIVLAGGTGFIGTFLRQRLAADGYEVVLLTRSQFKMEERFAKSPGTDKTWEIGKQSLKDLTLSSTSPADQSTAATTRRIAAKFSSLELIRHAYSVKQSPGLSALPRSG